MNTQPPTPQITQEALTKLSKLMTHRVQTKCREATIYKGPWRTPMGLFVIVKFKMKTAYTEPTFVLFKYIFLHGKIMWVWRTIDSTTLELGAENMYKAYS